MIYSCDVLIVHSISLMSSFEDHNITGFCKTNVASN